MAEVPPWFYQQSAVVPYREGTDGIEILLITTKKRKRWIIPKGVIDPGFDAPESASREAYEEAGIRGTVESPPLTEYRYDKWGGTCNVTVFIMRVTDELGEWPEAAFRNRGWFNLDQARKMVDKPELKGVLEAAARHFQPN